MYYIEVLGQENISIIPTTTVSTIMESTCTVNFETINNQPTINYQPTTTHNLSVNATFGTTTDSTTLTIILATTGSSICDRAWENRSYLHVKFDLILRV